MSLLGAKALGMECKENQRENWNAVREPTAKCLPDHKTRCPLASCPFLTSSHNSVFTEHLIHMVVSASPARLAGS